MKKRFTILITSALMLLTMMAQPLKVNGQAPVGTTLWAEDFSYYSANEVPSGQVDNNHTGTTVYGSGSVTYSVSDGGTTSKIYAANLAGGSSPELLISKTGGNFTIADIPTGNATELTFSYKTNNNNNAVSTTTPGVTITEVTGKASTKTFTVETGGAATINLTIANSASSNTRVDDFSLVVKTAGGSTSNPSITANNVVIAYNATYGSISYEVQNPASNGSMSAEVTAGDWLTLGSVGTTVPFTCTANTSGLDRSATVRLSYSYGNNQVAVKDVTVTQIGDPSAIMTIAEARAQGTGEVITKGVITSITGSTTKTAYIQDATAAIVVYGSMSSLVGDEIKVSGTLSDYNGLLEITNPVVTFLSDGNTIEPELMTIANINTSTNQGWYIRIEDATVTAINGQNTTIAQGDNTIVVRGISGVEYEVNDVLSLNGNIGCYNQVAQIANPQNVTVQTPPAVPTITVAPATVNATANGENGELTVTYTNFTDIDAQIYYCDAQGDPVQPDDWFEAVINTDNNVSYTIDANTSGPRTAYFKVQDGNFFSHLVTINQSAPEAPHCTWDLSTNSYSSATADLVTWLSTNAIMTNAKGTSTTAANNFLGGGSNNHTRFYQNQVLTITPNTGFAIDSVLINATSASYGEGFYGNTWTNATASAQGSVITVIPTEIDQPFSVVISKACRATTVTVYYEPSTVLYYFINLSDVTNGSIATDKTRALEGETVTLTATPDNNYYVSDWSVIDGDNNPVSWSASGAGLNEVTFSMPASSVTVSATFETSVSYHSISFGNIVNGTVVADPAQQALEGETVTLTVTPDAGYILNDDDISVYTNTATVEVTKVNSTTFTFVMPADDVTIMAVFTPFQASTYTLTTATTLESGRRYIIVGLSGENAYAMGGQNNNNRAAVGITMTPNGAQVSSPDVVEVVINGPDTLGYYTIYDANTPGYLYAASSSSNYLKTRQFNTDKNSQWTITFEDGGNAVITAQGNSTRNLMRLNNNNSVFSCYGSGQQAIYLYKKDEGDDPQYAFYKDIVGYGDPTNTGGYYLISCPVEGVDPANVSGLLNGEYDFYFFEQGAVGQEWQNYQAQASMNFEYAKGYLYANESSVTLGFFGTQPGQQGDLTLDKVPGVPFEGLNLIGNPFGYAASFNNKEFYVMNAAGDNLILANRTDNKVNPMEGIFVYADIDNEPVAFTTQSTTGDGKFVLDITKNRGSVIDRAVVRFGEGSSLPKFMLNPYSTKIYIPQDEDDYAAVTSSHNNEIPVSFEAAENGTYTLNLKINNTEMDYIHLIDNQTGNDVDLLQNPSYTFEANTTDYASRFRLVFSANSNSVNDHESNFGFISNGNLLILGIEGEATLQMIDLTGRILSTETFSGSYNKALDASAGVYMLRLIQGENVKTQKIVIK